MQRYKDIQVKRDLEIELITKDCFAWFCFVVCFFMKGRNAFPGHNLILFLLHEKNQ